MAQSLLEMYVPHSMLAVFDASLSYKSSVNFFHFLKSTEL